MPYIKDKAERLRLDEVVERYIGSVSNSTDWITGSLNYFLFKLAKDYCHSYEAYRDFIGELEAAKLEIYRRLAAPYEDKKIKYNGDVE